MNEADPRLAALQVKLSKLSDDELFEFVRGIRMERKVPQKQLQARKKKKRKDKGVLSDLLGGMDSGKIAALLEE